MTDAAENFATMPEAEFVTRFRAHMLQRAKRTTFSDGSSIAAYAERAAPSYWNDLLGKEEGPEACAEVDMEYWED